MIEFLTAALAGGLFSFEILKADASGLDPASSKLFLAIDVQAFTDPQRFAQRVEDLLTHLRDAEPGLTITFPGERGWQTRERYLAEGIPIHPDIAAQLQKIGIHLG
jgi:LDH2 family malate/lactate/ureidoglycolate dehydrogenase